MKSTFKYVNALNKAVEFILEPWAEEYELLPKQELVIVGTYEKEHAFCELDYHEDCVIFFAWEHSLVEVYIDGENRTLTSNSVMF